MKWRIIILQYVVGQKLKNKPVVSIIGVNSFIGSFLKRKLSEDNFEVISTSRRRNNNSDKFLDLSEDPVCWPEIKSDIAVICAGVTSIKSCEIEKDYTSKINLHSTSKLAKILAEQGTHVLLLSTSQVFDGSIPFVHHNSNVHPLSEYGRQKASAEQCIIGLKKNGSILRISKVLNKHSGIVNRWVLDLKNGKRILSYANLKLAPVFQDHVYKIVKQIIINREYGIFHCSASKDISYTDLALNLVNSLNLSKKLVEIQEVRKESIYLNRIPQHSTLNMEKEHKVFGIKQPLVEGIIEKVVN